MDFIYTLSDPRDNEIRYVGKTDNPKRRLGMHLREKYKTHKVHWIQELLANKLKPIMTVIEEVPDGQSWEDRERYWISYYRSIGCNLTNGTDGGDCGPDLRGRPLPKSEIGRQHIIEALVRRNKSPEMREVSRRTGKRQKGRKHSPQEIERIRKKMTGRRYHLTEKASRELAERNRTREYDSDTMRENARKLWDDPIRGPELRAKLAERNRLRHQKDAP